MTEDKKSLRVAPDGGWGYVCIGAVFILQSIFGMVVRSFGILYLLLLERYQTSATVAAWVGAVNLLIYGLTGPVSSVLCTRLEHRMVTMLGSVLLAVGYMITGFAPNLVFVYIGFGLCVGVGNSMIAVAGLLILDKYFHKKKSMATSISTSGVGVAMFIFLPLMNFFMEKYGFQGCMMLLSGVCLQGIVMSMLLRPIEYKFQNHQEMVILVSPAENFTDEETKYGEDMIAKSNTGDKSHTSEASHSDLGNIPLLHKQGSQDVDRVWLPEKSESKSTFVGHHETGTDLDDLIETGTNLDNFIENETESNVERIQFKPDTKDAAEHGSDVKGSKCEIIEVNVGCPKSETKLQDLVEKETETKLNEQGNKNAENADKSKCVETLLLDKIQSTSDNIRSIDFKNHNTDESSNNKTILEDSETKTCLSKVTPYMNLIRDVPPVAGMLLLMLTYTILDSCIYSFVPALSIDQGLPSLDAKLLLSWAGISDSLHRICYGFLMDCGLVRPWRIHLYVSLALTGSILTVLYPLCMSHAVFIAVMVMLGGCTGVVFAQRVTITSDLAGAERTPLVFGVVIALNAVGHATGRAMGGVIKDYTHSYDLLFYLSGSLCTLSAVLFLFLLIFFRHKSV